MKRRVKKQEACVCETELLAQGAVLEPLSLAETDALRQQWMRTYGATLPKGADIPLAAQRGGYDWHLFSYNVAYALSGAEATREYMNLEDTAFVVLPHTRDRRPGCRCICKLRNPPKPQVAEAPDRPSDKRRRRKRRRR